MLLGVVDSCDCELATLLPIMIFTHKNAVLGIVAVACGEIVGPVSRRKSNFTTRWYKPLSHSKRPETNKLENGN